MARRLSATRTVHDSLVGVYGFFRGDAGDVDAILLIEPVEDGWWYSAPLPECQFVVAFMTDADLCKEAGMREQSNWLVGMRRTKHIWARVSRFSLLAGPQVFGANGSRLDAFCGPGWLAVGDAACAQDPLSGDGVCRSLADGVVAADAIYADQSGNWSGLPEYGRGLEENWPLYLKRRHEYYARELRWPKSPFWVRRHSTRLQAASGRRQRSPPPSGSPTHGSIIESERVL